MPHHDYTAYVSQALQTSIADKMSLFIRASRHWADKTWIDNIINHNGRIKHLMQLGSYFVVNFRIKYHGYLLIWKGVEEKSRLLWTFPTPNTLPSSGYGGAEDPRGIFWRGKPYVINNAVLNNKHAHGCWRCMYIIDVEMHTSVRLWIKSSTFKYTQRKIALTHHLFFMDINH